MAYEININFPFWSTVGLILAYFVVKAVFE